MHTLSFSEFCNKLVVVVTTFNRPEITHICLAQLDKTINARCAVWVYDDYSTAYDIDFLTTACPTAIVKQATHKMGIESLRIYIHNDALSTGYHFIYHTDNDAFHDPLWLERLYQLYTAYPNYILSLFNSPFHIKYTFCPGKANSVIRSECPGVSYCYDLTRVGHLNITTFNNSWDYVIASLYGNRCAISQTSFVEHFGGGGINNDGYFRDIAGHPTEFLQAQRLLILSQLGVTPSNISYIPKLRTGHKIKIWVKSIYYMLWLKYTKG